MTDMKLKRALPVTALASALALVLAACSSPEVVEPPATTPSVEAPTPVRSAAPSPPANPRPDVVWPLTGIDAEGANEADLQRPALSIKIENSAAARPQDNLQYADIVFEEQVEAGVSRFVAVYHSDVPETVGPIRSMRPMDKNIMGSISGPLIFSGAQGRFISGTRDTGQAMIAQDTGGSGFFRVSDKRAPHNLHGRTADFYAQSSDLPAPTEQFEYAYPAEDSNVQTAGTEISNIDLNLSGHQKPSWDWNGELWMRSEGSSPHVTKDGTQLSTTNVVVLWVDVRPTGRGPGGGSVPETIVVTDSGTGWAASGNKYIPITWSKAGQFEPFVLTTEDGDPVTLMPGQTWVELAPQSGGAGKGTIAFN